MSDERYAYVEYDENGDEQLRVEFDKENEREMELWKFVHDTGGNFFGRAIREEESDG